MTIDQLNEKAAAMIVELFTNISEIYENEIADLTDEERDLFMSCFLEQFGQLYCHFAPGKEDTVISVFKGLTELSDAINTESEE